MEAAAAQLSAWMGASAVVATLLALVAALAGRWVRRPAILHAMWALVLVRLVTPPLLSIPLVPARFSPTAVPAPLSAEIPLAVRDAGAVGSARLAVGPTGDAVRPRVMAPALLAVSLAGSLWVVALAAYRARRFRELLRGIRPATGDLAAAARRAARDLGLPPARLPRLGLVNAAVPPMLWIDGRELLLLMPEGLVRRLSDQGRELLLAHELAHVARRDHWMRLVELAATAVFWWLPVTWWARRALRRAEERACDERVLAARPASNRAYAEALLETVSLLARRPTPPLPAGATGAAPIRDLEQRFQEILMMRRRSDLSRPARHTLLALAALSLAVFPGAAEQDERSTVPVPRPRPSAEAAPAPGAPRPLPRAQESPDAAPAPSEPRRAVPLRGSSDATGDDERERIELESRLRQLELERLELERRHAEAAASLELSRMEQRVRELERSDREAEARRVSSQMEHRQAQLALQQRHMQARAEHTARVGALQMRAAELQLELQRDGRDRESADRLGDELRVVHEQIEAASGDRRRLEMEMAEALESLEAERRERERAWLETLEGPERERVEQERRHLERERARRRDASERERAAHRDELEARRRTRGTREEAAYRDAERERERRARGDAETEGRELDERQRAERARLEELLAAKTRELADLEAAGYVGAPVDRLKREIDEIHAALGQLRP
jgi:beta-lactamase regulating signal transducer with metallopeptidase domain